MRKYFFLVFFLTMLQDLSAQDSSKVTVYPLPAHISSLFGFENIENSFSMVPLNGGIYCPEINRWYLVPNRRDYLSVSYSPEDSTVSFSVFSNKGSYIKTSRIKNARKSIDSFFLPSKGLYFVKRLKKDIIIYGGITSGHYKVYQLASQKSTLLFSYLGSITNLQVIAQDMFFFQVGKRIFIFKKGYKPKCVFASSGFIDGFCVDSKMTLYISRKEGVFRFKHRTASLILPYHHGTLKINGRYLYLLSFQESEFIKMRL